MSIIGKTARKLFQMSDETRILVTLLREASMGDVVTYERMNQLTGRDIQRHRGPLTTARKRLEQDDGIFFEVLIGEGVVRIDHGEAARTQERGVRLIHRSAHRYERRASSIDFDAIPASERAMHVARTTFFGLVRGATSTKGRDKLLAAVNASEEKHQLDLKKALSALMP